jgi:hypothetical protein
MRYILILYSDLGRSLVALRFPKLLFYKFLIFSMRATSCTQTVFNDLIIRAYKMKSSYREAPYYVIIFTLRKRFWLDMPP